MVAGPFMRKNRLKRDRLCVELIAEAGPFMRG